MKNKLVIAFLFFGSLLSFTKKRTEDAYKADVKKSSIEWIAGKVTGEHKGLVKLADGNLVIDGDQIKKAQFSIDMKSISVTDLKGTSAQNLLGHLKGEDFFSVENYPNATFTLTKASPIINGQVQLTGNLSIKGKTNSISFPATIKTQKGNVIAEAKNVKVDRTKYDIRYRSKSFFGDIGDKAIDDEFILNIILIGKK